MYYLVVCVCVHTHKHTMLCVAVALSKQVMDVSTLNRGISLSVNHICLQRLLGVFPCLFVKKKFFFLFIMPFTYQQNLSDCFSDCLQHIYSTYLLNVSSRIFYLGVSKDTQFTPLSTHIYIYMKFHPPSGV